MLWVLKIKRKNYFMTIKDNEEMINNSNQIANKLLLILKQECNISADYYEVGKSIELSLYSIGTLMAKLILSLTELSKIYNIETLTTERIHSALNSVCIAVIGLNTKDHESELH
jgi:hypothetical protein